MIIKIKLIDLIYWELKMGNEQSLLDYMARYNYLKNKLNANSGILSPHEMALYKKLEGLIKERLGVGINPEKIFGTPKKEENKYPSLVTLHYKDINELGDKYLNGLYKGGLFVEMEHPLPLGSKIRIRVHLQNERKSVDMIGKVVWTNTSEVKRLGSRIPKGCGFKLENLDKEMETFFKNLTNKDQKEELERL